MPLTTLISVGWSSSPCRRHESLRAFSLGGWSPHHAAEVRLTLARLLLRAINPEQVAAGLPPLGEESSRLRTARPPSVYLVFFDRLFDFLFVRIGVGPGIYQVHG